VEFAVDLGSGVRCRKAFVPCLWPVTDIFQLKLHLTKVQSCFVCVRKGIQLLCVVFCVSRFVRKFDFRPVINEKRTTPYSDRDCCFWQDLYVLLPPSSRGLRDSYASCEGHMHSLEKGHYSFTGTGVANYNIDMHCHEHIGIQYFDQWRHRMSGQEAPDTRWASHS